MATARVPRGTAPMLNAMVHAQRQLHGAWLEARHLHDARAEVLLGEAMVATANAIGTTFPDAFADPMLCFEEPVDVEEVGE